MIKKFKVYFSSFILSYSTILIGYYLISEAKIARYIRINSFLSSSHFSSSKSLTSSRNFTGVLKLGFFLAFWITDEYRMCPAHSISTLGLSTVMRCTRFKSRRPQNRTSILWVKNNMINLRP